MAENTGIEIPYTPSPSSTSTGTASREGAFAFEMLAVNYTDPVAYSNAISNWVTNNSGIPKAGYKNQLDYYQALLRQSGISKDTTPRGILGAKDADAIKKVSQIALQNNVPFETMLVNLYQSGTGQGEVKFSKNISTAIRLIDKGDARSALSNEYFRAFGEFPTENIIEQFMNLYNVEAKKQTSKSTTSTTTSGGVSRSKTITEDEGFTQKEQTDFLAKYLSSNFNIATSKNLGGTAKAIYDDITENSRNNFLSAPEFTEVAGLIASVIGAGDDKVSNQMLTDYKNQQRRVASKQYLGLEAELLAGEDVITYSKPILEFVRKASGRNISADDKFIKNALNFKDDKGNYRLMNEFEMRQAWLNDPRSATSPDSINQYTDMADKLASKLGR